MSDSRAEHGFTMILTMAAMLVVSLLVVAALAAANGDLGLVRADSDSKRAYAAAQAGVNDYVFKLTRDHNFWTTCATAPGVNQQGSTVKRRPVPGSSGASYAMEVLPASTSPQPSCSTADPAATMLEGAASLGGSTYTGTFRIRATGYAGNARRSLVAQFRRKSFLDFLYFTDYETLDPEAYPDEASVTNAYDQCRRWYREGRPSSSSAPDVCVRIVFAGGEKLRGPFHTNDAFVSCYGSPIFGRSPQDAIEVSDTRPGYLTPGNCAGSVPDFRGSFTTNAEVLPLPVSNGNLRASALPSHRFTGQVKVELQGATMTVTQGTDPPVVLPATGVLYVDNGVCSTGYSPFTASYPATSGCGNVYVHGTYSGQLTIAARNDVVIDGPIARGSGSNGLLGLVAENYVRVYHPCDGGLPDLRIDAALLALNHSFIVDHYNCGPRMGTLSVTGAIAQKFRGPVGIVGGSGYSKDYEYDDRLRYQEPPYFPDPVQSSWRLIRQTQDAP